MNRNFPDSSDEPPMLDAEITNPFFLVDWLRFAWQLGCLYRLAVTLPLTKCINHLATLCDRRQVFALPVPVNPGWLDVSTQHHAYVASHRSSAHKRNTTNTDEIARERE